MRFLWLDGLRGLAACYVLSFHFFKGSNVFASFGWIAVDFFFVLSGFILCNSITLAGATGRLGFAKFLKKRILRLFPVLFLALFLRLLLQLSESVLEFIRGSVGNTTAFDSSDLIRYLLSILLLQFLYPFSVSLVFPLWSLSTEFYSNLFQIISRLTGSIRKISFGILLGILLIIASGIYFDSGPDWIQYNTWLFGFGRALVGFNIGQLVWNFQQRKFRVSWMHSLFIALVGFVVSINVWVFANEFVLASAYFSFGFLVLSFSKFKNPAQTSDLFRLLKVLGETSYPVYLFHTIILPLFLRVFTSLSLVNFIAFYLMNVIFSFLVLKYLEPKVRVFISKYVRV